MKKMIKKIAAAFMAMALVAVGMLAANKAEVKAAAYYVAGDAALCGANWSADAPANAMTDNGGGMYSITYTDVAVGIYGFKVTDGTWDHSWGDNGQNYQIQVESVCDVTITFNSTTYEVNATGTGLVTPTLDVEKIIIAGSAGLFGTNFDQTDDNNKMTASNSVYTKTYTNVAAGTYEAKFTANGAWTDNWGGTYIASGTESDAVYNANDNITFAVPYTQSTVTFKLDLTDFDYGTKTGATFTITVVDTTPVESPTGDDNNETTTAADDDDDETTAADDDDETTAAADDDDETTAADDDDETTAAADDDDETTAADDDDDETTAADDDDETTAAADDEGGSSAGDTPAGDNSMVAIFAILAVLAAAGVVTVAVAKRRAIEE